MNSKSVSIPNSVFEPRYPTDGDILQHIAQWSFNQRYLQYLPNVAHGWERWAQLDIFFYLWSNKHEARVEEYIYMDSIERMDLAVKLDNQNRTDFVELKAWSYLVVKELKDFFADVTSDAMKLIDGKYDEKFNGGYAWSIGLLPEAAVLDQRDSKGNIYKTPVFDPTRAEEAKRAHIERVLRPFSLVDEYGIQFSFVETAGPLILVYWRSKIDKGKVHS